MNFFESDVKFVFPFQYSPL